MYKVYIKTVDEKKVGTMEQTNKGNMWLCAFFMRVVLNSLRIQYAPDNSNLQGTDENGSS